MSRAPHVEPSCACYSELFAMSAPSNLLHYWDRLADIFKARNVVRNWWDLTAAYASKDDPGREFTAELRSGDRVFLKGRHEVAVLWHIYVREVLRGPPSGPLYRRCRRQYWALRDLGGPPCAASQASLCRAASGNLLPVVENCPGPGSRGSGQSGPERPRR